jgi:hypothetical protein
MPVVDEPDAIAVAGEHNSHVTQVGRDALRRRVGRAKPGHRNLIQDRGNDPVLAHVQRGRAFGTRRPDAAVAVPTPVSGMLVDPVGIHPTSTLPTLDQSHQQIRTGDRATWCRSDVHILSTTELDLADQRAVCDLLRDGPLAGRVGPMRGPGAQRMLGALAMPNLPAGVAGVGQDCGDRAQRPGPADAVRVAGSIDSRRRRHPELVESPGNAGEATPRQPLGEHPPYVASGGQVGLQPPKPATPLRVGRVGVRAGIDESVPVGRTPAQIPSLIDGLGAHRGGDAKPRTKNLPPGLGAQYHHQCSMSGIVLVERAADLGQPQLHTGPGKRRRHGHDLIGTERPLVLADDDHVETTTRHLGRGQQRRRLLPPVPCPTSRADIEVLRHDPAPTGQQILGHAALPLK